MTDATRNDMEPFIVPTGEGALITSGNMTDIEILIPGSQHVADEDDVPELMLYLIACAVRFRDDPEFVQEQLDWMSERQEEMDA